MRVIFEYILRKRLIFNYDSYIQLIFLYLSCKCLLHNGNEKNINIYIFPQESNIFYLFLALKRLY